MSDLRVTCPDPVPLAPSSLVNSPVDLHTHTRARTHEMGETLSPLWTNHLAVGLRRLRPDVRNTFTLRPFYDVSLTFH